MALLNVNNLKKVYTTRLGGARVTALSGVSFTVEEGEFVAIMGESGSGKTTLLNILAGLDKPTSGEVFLNMRNIVTLNEKEICDYITHELHRSATVWGAIGAYTGTEHQVVLTVLTRVQAVAIRRFAKSVDSTSFVLVLNSSEIFGKGFLRG